MPRTSISLAVVVLAAVLHLAGPVGVLAQGFSLNRFRPAPSSDEGFGLLSPAPPPHLTLDARLVVDYAYGSLAVSTPGPDGRTKRGYLVEQSFTTHVAVSLGLADWFGVWASLPVALVQSGTDVSSVLPVATPITGPAFGDAEVGVRFLLFGERGRPEEGVAFSLGVAASLLFPSGSPEALTGDGKVGFRGLVTAAIPNATLTPIVNVGVAYRPDIAYMPNPSGDILARPGSELLLGIGAQLHLDPVRIDGELRSATTMTGDQAFSGDALALEVLLGAHFDLGSGFTTGVAVDFGVTQAVGVPAVRLLGTFGYALSFAGDDEGDDEGGEGSAGGGSVRDADGDGDGVPSDHDDCPNLAEDFDGIEDEDGCPEEDADGDGSLDIDDFCPTEPETINDYMDDDGCPDGARIEGSAIVTTEGVTFDHRRARLSPESEAALALIAELLQDDREIALVQIEGHAAENEGNTNRKLRVSEQRAEAVLRFLTGQGVSVERLTFVGMGSDVPAAEGDHEENRRVTFRILERR